MYLYRIFSIYFWQFHACIQSILIIVTLNPSPHSSWTFSTFLLPNLRVLFLVFSLMPAWAWVGIIQWSTSGHTPEEKWLPQWPIASNLGWGLPHDRLSTQECWLAWFGVSLVPVTVTAVSSWVPARVSCSKENIPWHSSLSAVFYRLSVSDALVDMDVSFKAEDSKVTSSTLSSCTFFLTAKISFSNQSDTNLWV